MGTIWNPALKTLPRDCLRTRLGTTFANEKVGKAARDCPPHPVTPND